MNGEIRSFWPPKEIDQMGILNVTPLVPIPDFRVDSEVAAAVQAHDPETRMPMGDGVEDFKFGPKGTVMKYNDGHTIVAGVTAETERPVNATIWPPSLVREVAAHVLKRRAARWHGRGSILPPQK